MSNKHDALECKEQVGDPVDHLVEERSLSWEGQIYIEGNYGLELKFSLRRLHAPGED
jgi:hypothetical protein